MREGLAGDAVEVDEKGNMVGIGVWRASKDILDQASWAVAERMRQHQARHRRVSGLQPRHLLKGREGLRYGLLMDLGR